MEFEIKKLERTIKLLQKENTLLRRRINAIEKLGVCYRLQSQPTEKLFDELGRTERMLKKLDVVVN